MNPLTPVIILLVLFVINRIWMWKVISPIAAANNERITRWRIIGHFYDVRSVYKMLQRLSYNIEGHDKYDRICFVFVLLHLLIVFALAWTVWSMVQAL